MRILVLGGTRGTGRAVVEKALAQGHEVSVLARRPASLSRSHASLKVLAGDVLDAAAVREAVAGQDAVIYAVGAALDALRADPTLISRGTENTIAAMKAAAQPSPLHAPDPAAPAVKRLRVLGGEGDGRAPSIPGSARRLVVLSAFGTGDSRPFGGLVLKRVLIPFFFGPSFADHERQERLTRESGLEWVIVRPSRLTDGSARGKYKVVTGPGAVPGSISRADVAAFMLVTLETDWYVGKVVGIGG
jgi:uncharacterized protein YbjT (DUF2867 family)